MRKNICKCGHSESDHANHYEYHQCYILGCECLNFEAAQKRYLMKFCFRKQSGIKVVGFNVAEDGIYCFLWWVEFALVWRNPPPLTQTVGRKPKT